MLKGTAMDLRAIGVFDSGLGGLTAVSALEKLMPNQDIVYLADTARVPYGSKSKDELLKCADEDIAFLLSKNVKLIIIACGTVSSTLSEEQINSFSVPVISVLNGAAFAAVKQSRGKIGIIATEASVKSGAYKKKILKASPNSEVLAVACPKLVPLIEDGGFDGQNREVEAALNEYLLPLKEAKIDTLILGCTHYPLLNKQIEKIIPSVSLIDVGKEAARAANEVISQKEMFRENKKGKTTFYVSGDCESFKKNAARFLGRDIDEVKKAVLSE